MLASVLAETAAFAAATPPVEDGRSPVSVFLLGVLVCLGLILTLATLVVAWRVLSRAEAERPRPALTPPRDPTGPADDAVVLNASGRRVEPKPESRGDA
ncbi:MAG: hypothetical protein AAGG07_08125 [Planctomycetota bacterium]